MLPCNSMLHEIDIFICENRNRAPAITSEPGMSDVVYSNVKTFGWPTLSRGVRRRATRLKFSSAIGPGGLARRCRATVGSNELPAALAGWFAMHRWLPYSVFFSNSANTRTNEFVVHNSIVLLFYDSLKICLSAWLDENLKNAFAILLWEDI